jgi:hypothetical protein
MSSQAWDAFGNFVSLAGIAISAVAYLVEHRGRSLGELEPGLLRFIRKVRAGLYRLLGIKRGVTIHAGMAADTLVFGGEARGEVWTPINDTDPLDAQLAATISNVERLRQRVNNDWADLREKQREDRRVIEERLSDLERARQEQDRADQALATRSMRWQVRGLALALVGTAVSAVATLVG